MVGDGTAEVNVREQKGKTGRLNRGAIRSERGHGGGVPITRAWVIDCLEAAHEVVTFNREFVLASTDCGCAYCLAVFPASRVRQWTDGSRRYGRTALCPRCGLDTVLPDVAGFPLTPLFLQAMQARWCSPVIGRRAGG